MTVRAVGKITWIRSLDHKEVKAIARATAGRSRFSGMRRSGLMLMFAHAESNIDFANLCDAREEGEWTERPRNLRGGFVWSGYQSGPPGAGTLIIAARW